MKHAIKLVCEPQKGWLAIHSNPEVAAVFGTNTIQTAFTSKAPAATVLERIKQLNPDCIVTVSHP